MSDKRYRHEYKYIIDAMQEGVLRVRVGGVLMPDIHADDSGSYIVRSLYFDDLYDTCLTENLQGTDPRSKFRLRYYNNDTSRVVLEKKSKRRSMCLKESCQLTAPECEQLSAGQIPLISDDMPPVKKRLLTEMLVRGLIPKIIVSYERIPQVYEAGNVRITFDRAITSSVETAKFLDGGYSVRPVLAKGVSVLEVKWDEVMPQHIKETLQLERLNWTAFSKYYMCRKYHL